MEEVEYASVACTVVEHGSGGIFLYSLHSGVIMEEVEYATAAAQREYGRCEICLCSLYNGGIWKGGICLYNLHSEIIMEEVQYVYLASQSVYSCL